MAFLISTAFLTLAYLKVNSQDFRPMSGMQIDGNYYNDGDWAVTGEYDWHDFLYGFRLNRSANGGYNCGGWEDCQSQCITDWGMPTTRGTYYKAGIFCDTYGTTETSLLGSSSDLDPYNWIPLVTTSAGPAKTDLTNIYYAGSKQDLTICAALERISVNGRSYLDMEFNQEFEYETNSSVCTEYANYDTRWKCAYPVRTDGDIQIAYDVASSVSSFYIRVDRWNGSTDDWDVLTDQLVDNCQVGGVCKLDATGITAALNTQEINASSFGFIDTSKNEPGVSTIYAGAFLEACIDFLQLQIYSIDFASIIIKSKSSPTGSLKDTSGVLDFAIVGAVAEPTSGAPTMPSSLPTTAAPTTGTTGPTNPPSRDPTTGTPTRTPTGVTPGPTGNPTAAPTTSEPSLHPSGSPSTVSPTDVPTAMTPAPSAVTAGPSADPTANPSGSPTVQPTATPSINPTFSRNPTSAPTAQTAAPSTAPSGVPTTDEPSRQPTPAPLTGPPTFTRNPSKEPTVVTGAPSTDPTSAPIEPATDAPSTAEGGDQDDDDQGEDDDGLGTNTMDEFMFSTMFYIVIAGVIVILVGAIIGFYCHRKNKRKQRDEDMFGAGSAYEYDDKFEAAQREPQTGGGDGDIQTQAQAQPQPQNTSAVELMGDGRPGSAQRVVSHSPEAHTQDYGDAAVPPPPSHGVDEEIASARGSPMVSPAPQQYGQPPPDQYHQDQNQYQQRQDPNYQDQNYRPQDDQRQYHSGDPHRPNQPNQPNQYQNPNPNPNQYQNPGLNQYHGAPYSQPRQDPYLPGPGPQPNQDAPQNMPYDDHNDDQYDQNQFRPNQDQFSRPPENYDDEPEYHAPNQYQAPAQGPDPDQYQGPGPDANQYQAAGPRQGSSGPGPASRSDQNEFIPVQDAEPYQDDDENLEQDQHLFRANPDQFRPSYQDDSDSSREFH